MSLLGSFGRSTRTRGWAVLDGLHSKELILVFLQLHGCSCDSNMMFFSSHFAVSSSRVQSRAC